MGDASTQVAYVTAFAVGGTRQVVAPIFSPPAGTYATAQTVTIATDTAGASIRYTTDGTYPASASGSVYTAPVSVSASLTMRAIACESGMVDSSVSSAEYVIGGPPAVPTGLVVGSPTSSSLDVGWSPVAGATSFELYRDTSAGGSFLTMIYSGAPTSFTDSGLSAATTYYYKVRALNPYGASALSATASGTTMP